MYMIYNSYCCTINFIKSKGGGILYKYIIQLKQQKYQH